VPVASRLVVAILALVLLIGLTAVGCAAPTLASPSAPSGTPAVTPTPALETPSPSAAASTSPAPGVTDTEWGAIWDALPPGFPRYPGSTPTETGGGPASATLDAPADVPTVTTWFQAALERMGFSTFTLSGPAEDGSMEIESVGPTTGCLVRTTVTPLGGPTIVTVFYGANCPPT
jgi:hypothetical protein